MASIKESTCSKCWKGRGDGELFDTVDGNAAYSMDAPQKTENGMAT